MSYFGDLAQAKADAEHADVQIDGLNPSDTSPVRSGADSDPGAAPMNGKHEFTTERTRGNTPLGQGSFRRHYPDTKATNI